MPTNITDYFLKVINKINYKAEILDGTSYYAYQVYVNNKFVVESTSSPIYFGAQKDQKIDILGVSQSESGFDFYSTLSDLHGDKLALELPNTFSGTVKIFSDAGTGQIDYGRLLATVDFNEPIVVGWSHESWSHFNWGESSPSSLSVIYTTGRQPNGPLKFGIVPVTTSISGLPVVLNVTFAHSPDQVQPEVRSYDPVEDVLIIELRPFTPPPI